MRRSILSSIFAAAMAAAGGSPRIPSFIGSGHDSYPRPYRAATPEGKQFAIAAAVEKRERKNGLRLRHRSAFHYREANNA